MTDYGDVIDFWALLGGSRLKEARTISRRLTLFTFINWSVFASSAARRQARNCLGLWGHVQRLIAIKPAAKNVAADPGLSAARISPGRVGQDLLLLTYSTFNGN
ncbi:hypothetical protein PoB_000125500 [Plakobranchus ocellatus]|uniref:Uncharacterized protein n=1 Tax=Plakobranchus ocellatus TaxID=259542 RepID=A0AAV3XVA8_9GAST|nr:hypothetical protein PoB_000125500 [Plakobranchus ocellatus]